MQDRVAFCNFIISQDGGDSFMLKLFEPWRLLVDAGVSGNVMSSCWSQHGAGAVCPADAIQGCMAVAVWKFAAY